MMSHGTWTQSQELDGNQCAGLCRPPRTLLHSWVLACCFPEMQRSKEPLRRAQSKVGSGLEVAENLHLLSSTEQGPGFLGHWSFFLDHRGHGVSFIPNLIFGKKKDDLSKRKALQRKSERFCHYFWRQREVRGSTRS